MGEPIVATTLGSARGKRKDGQPQERDNPKGENREGPALDPTPDRLHSF